MVNNIHITIVAMYTICSNSPDTFLTHFILPHFVRPHFPINIWSFAAYSYCFSAGETSGVQTIRLLSNGGFGAAMIFFSSCISRRVARFLLQYSELVFIYLTIFAQRSGYECCLQLPWPSNIHSSLIQYYSSLSLACGRIPAYNISLLQIATLGRLPFMPKYHQSILHTSSK